MSDSKIQLSVEKDVAVITLDDGKVNAIQQAFLDDLNGALDEAADAAAVVVTGREGFLSAGLDLKTLPFLEADALRTTLRSFTDTMIRMFLHPRPVVASITGHAIAGGCVIALTADRRVMAEGPYKIGLNEVAIGITLPRFVIDMARAALPTHRHVETILHAQLYPPPRALEVGYVEEVLDPARTLARAMEIATTLTDLSAEAYAGTKEFYRGHLIAETRERTEAELDGFVRAMRPKG